MLFTQIRRASAARFQSLSRKRDYPAAIAALNSLQSLTSLVDETPEVVAETMTRSVTELGDWCNRVGYKPEQFNAINVLHISGTKGKGSTSAFLSSILTEYTKSQESKAALSPTSFQLRKVGLFTSPHLHEVRERIQINGSPISHDKFAKYLFEVWDRFVESEARMGIPQAPQPQMPAYFRFMTFMALHTFLREGVNAAIMETGIGGEYDCTNVVPRPAVTGVSSLGYDHTYMLGTTLPKIAWHKAGIFKPTVPAITVEQPIEALDVLKARAIERKTADGGHLHVVGIHPAIANGTAKLGLAGDFQKSNASLAVAMAARFLRDQGVALLDHTNVLPTEFQRGLEHVNWPCRCDRRPDGKQDNLVWYIDGAHTIESLQLAGQWFHETSKSDSESSPSKPRRILIFNQPKRDTIPLLRTLIELTEPSRPAEPYFSDVIFTTSTPFSSADTANTVGNGGAVTGRPDTSNVYLGVVLARDEDPLTFQKKLGREWEQLQQSKLSSNSVQGQTITITGSIEEAVEKCRALGSQDPSVPVHVLVTGSLYLSAGMLEVISPNQ